MANRPSRPCRPSILLAPALAALAALAPPPDAGARGFDYDKGWVTRAAAAADLDGDGAPDLVLAQSFLTYGPQRGRVAILFGDPGSPGRWRSRIEVPVGANPVAILLSDLDGNGRPDIATANATGGTATVLLQGPAGGFTPADYAATTGPAGIAAGDLDRDGLTDLAVAGTGEAVALFQDPSAPGTFLAPAVVAAGVAATCIAAADMDGAPGTDIVLGLTDTIEVLLQDSVVPGSFSAVAPLPIPGENLSRIVAADLDGNGRTDIACAMLGLPYGGPGRGLGLLLQDAAGGLSFASSTVDPGQPLRTLEMADMEGDGTPDLLATGADRVLWYRQDPAARGTFARKGSRVASASDGGTAGADFDGDGFVDAMVALFRPFLLLQNSSKPGSFRPAKAYKASAP